MKELEKSRNNRLFIMAQFVVYTLMVLYYSYGVSQKEFWYDEMATIGYIASNLSVTDVLEYFYTIEATNLPLYSLILYMVYHGCSVNMFGLFLPGLLFGLLGIVGTIKLADAYAGRWGAYGVLLVSLFSTTIYNRMALSLRAYSLLFCLTVWVMYYWLKYQTDKRKFDFAVLTVLTILLVYTHYFGTLYVAVLGIFSIVLAVLKKADKKLIIPFVIAGATFLPWFMKTMVLTSVDMLSFWIAPPALSDVFSAVGFLLSSSYILCVLYGTGCICVLIGIQKKRSIKKEDVLYLFVPWAVVILIFIYSRYINPAGGLFEPRYFMVLLPSLLIITAYGLQKIGEYCGDSAGIKKAFGIIGMGLFILALVESGMKCYTQTAQQYDKYSFAGDYIQKQGDLQNQDVLLIMTCYDDVGEVAQRGWYDYYFARYGIEAGNVEFVRSGTVDAVMGAYKESINRVYVFGDMDHSVYTGNDYLLQEQYGFQNLSVYEKSVGE